MLANKRLGTGQPGIAGILDKDKAWRGALRAAPAFALGSILLACRFIDPSSLPDVCLFRMITGFPCMFCGLTHAFHAISLGHFSEAIRYHPLAFPAYGLVVFHFVLACLRAFGWKHPRLLPALAFQTMLTGTFTVFTFVWILRIFQFPS
jgi:Protein of unknown function (DUF2752)